MNFAVRKYWKDGEGDYLVYVELYDNDSQVVLEYKEQISSVRYV